MATKTTAPNANPVHSMLPYFPFFRSTKYSTPPVTMPPRTGQTHSTRPNLCLSAGPRQRSKGESVTVGEVSYRTGVVRARSTGQPRQSRFRRTLGGNPNSRDHSEVFMVRPLKVIGWL